MVPTCIKDSSGAAAWFARESTTPRYGQRSSNSNQRLLEHGVRDRPHGLEGQGTLVEGGGQALDEGQETRVLRGLGEVPAGEQAVDVLRVGLLFFTVSGV